MKNSIKKGIVGLVGLCSIAIGGNYLVNYTKNWAENKIEQKITQFQQKEINKPYEQKEIQRIEEELKKYTDSKLSKYEQKDRKWTKQKFEQRVPLEELVEAFTSTYKIINRPYYKTEEGKIIKGSRFSGSGILLKGGYYLTAKHVVNKKFPSFLIDTYKGAIKHHHNKLSIDGKYKLEKVVLGKDLDYALLKLKDSKDLPFYSKGFNLPNNVKLGMRSVAMGFSTEFKNIRLGNLSQIGSGKKKNYLYFRNNLMSGDSGGPLFVIEDGKIKLTAITLGIKLIQDQNFQMIYHPINIGLGLKTSVILEDIEKQLKSRCLDKKYAKELENFLRLNR